MEKHAEASAVVVSVASGPRRTLVVAVTDDGVGLGADHAPGIGLATSTDAVRRLGGTLRVVPDPQGGTTWRLELPC